MRNEPRLVSSSNLKRGASRLSNLRGSRVAPSTPTRTNSPRFAALAMDCFELQIARKAVTGATCEARQCERGGEVCRS